MRISIEELLGRIRIGDRIALSQGITLLESTLAKDRTEARKLIRQLGCKKKSFRIAISGSPGVGKSTFIDILGYQLIQSGFNVAILTIDPSSEISGGSILGDKTRMNRLSNDKHAFIRPSPTLGILGGVGSATYETTLLCEEAGYDFIIIETVGVGQSEIMAQHLADMFIVLIQPGSGDELQSIKRGILESADLLVVNKWDSELKIAAEKTHAQYKAVGQDDQSKVLLISALENKGIDQVTELIFRHRDQISLVDNQKGREIYWFMDRTKRLILETILERESKFFQELKQDILSGDLTYSEAIEKALHKICP